jgi:epoxyqueuosine reductase QueG
MTGNCTSALESSSTIITTRQLAQKPMQNVALCCEICVHVCCRTSFQLAALRFNLAAPASFAAPFM